MKVVPPKITPEYLARMKPIWARIELMKAAERPWRKKPKTATGNK